jgi:hypothetical protein
LPDPESDFFLFPASTAATFERLRRRLLGTTAFMDAFRVISRDAYQYKCSVECLVCGRVPPRFALCADAGAGELRDFLGFLREVGLRRLMAVPPCHRRSSLQPDEPFYVVDEAGEPDLESCPSEPDGSDEEAHSVLLLGEEVVGARTADLRPLARRIGVGIGRPAGFLRWTWR